MRNSVKVQSLILILFLPLCCSSQKKIDSLLSVLSSHNTQNDSLQTLNAITDFYIYNDSKTAKFYAEKALELAQSTMDSTRIADAYLAICKMYAFSGKIDSSLISINRIRHYAISNNYKLFTVYNYLGNIHDELNTKDSSLYFAEKALEVVEDPIDRGTILSNLAQYYQTNSQEVLAGQYYLEAIKLLETTDGSDRYLASIYLNAAAFFGNNGQGDQGIDFYKRAIQKAKSAEMKYWQGFAALNLGERMEVQGYAQDSILKYFTIAENIFENFDDPFQKGRISMRFGLQYLKLGQTDRALIYLRSAENSFKKVENPEYKIILTQALTNGFLNNQNIEKALEYAANLEQMQSSLNSKTALDAYFTLAEVFQKSGNLAKSNQYLFKYTTLKDSLSSIEQLKQIAELQTKYETEKKEAEIASLNQQYAIQELQIKQKNQTIYFSLISFLLILAVVYFIYYQQIAARKRKQTELEQRFLLSQLNPHFISNALVAVQSSLLEKDTESASAYLHTFSRLMREIMENSREEFISVEDEVTMLEDYLEINQKRLGNAFGYSITVDEKIDQQLDAIPPMFVQPFVENAIEHGLATAGNEGEINVEFTKEGDFVKITVMDNGKGLSVQNEDASSKKSLSSSIIKERMELFNRSLKNKIELLVDNRVDKEGKIMGTMVELRVPIQQ